MTSRTRLALLAAAASATAPTSAALAQNAVRSAPVTNAVGVGIAGPGTSGSAIGSSFSVQGYNPFPDNNGNYNYVNASGGAVSSPNNPYSTTAVNNATFGVLDVPTAGFSSTSSNPYLAATGLASNAATLNLFNFGQTSNNGVVGFASQSAYPLQFFLVTDNATSDSSVTTQSGAATSPLQFSLDQNDAPAGVAPAGSPIGFAAGSQLIPLGVTGTYVNTVNASGGVVNEGKNFAYTLDLTGAASYINSQIASGTGNLRIVVEAGENEVIGGNAGGASFYTANAAFAATNPTLSANVSTGSTGAYGLIFNPGANRNVNTVDSNFTVDPNAVALGGAGTANASSPAHNGDVLTFGNAGADTSGGPGTVAIAAGGLSVRLLTVTNTAGTYTFTGGPLGGPTGLVKTGAGTLALSAPNTFTGTTNVSGGTLAIAADADLGTATAAGVVGGVPNTLLLSAAAGTTTTLQANGTVTSNRNVSLAGLATGGTVNVNTNGFAVQLNGITQPTAPASGATAGLGTLRVSGGGTLTLTGNNTPGQTNGITFTNLQSFANPNPFTLVAVDAGTTFNIAPARGNFTSATTGVPVVATVAIAADGTQAFSNSINANGVGSAPGSFVGNLAVGLPTDPNNPVQNPGVRMNLQGGVFGAVGSTIPVYTPFTIFSNAGNTAIPFTTAVVNSNIVANPLNLGSIFTAPDNTSGNDVNRGFVFGVGGTGQGAPGTSLNFYQTASGATVSVNLPAGATATAANGSTYTVKVANNIANYGIGSNYGVFNGVISGKTDLAFGSSVNTGNPDGIQGGTGIDVLNAKNTYTGDTRIYGGTNGSAFAAFRVYSTLRTGIDNALPATTNLVFGGPAGHAGTAASNGALDLFGHTQTVASLSSNFTGSILTSLDTANPSGISYATATVLGGITNFGYNTTQSGTLSGKLATGQTYTNLPVYVTTTPIPAALVINGSTQAEYDGPIGAVLDGPATNAITAANTGTYAGTVNGTTVNYGASQNGFQPATFNPNGSLKTLAISAEGNDSISLTLNLQPGGVQTLGGASTFTGGTTVNSGTLVVNTPDPTAVAFNASSYFVTSGVGNGPVVNNATFTVTGNVPITVNGLASPTVVTGTGTTTLPRLTINPNTGNPLPVALLATLTTGDLTQAAVVSDGAVVLTGTDRVSGTATPTGGATGTFVNTDADGTRGTLSIGTAAPVVFTAGEVRQSAVAIGAGSVLSLTNNPTKATVSIVGNYANAATNTVAGTLSIAGTPAAPTGRLDVGNNDLVVRNGTVAAVTALAASGYAAGTFAGQGLASTAAAANALRNTAVGVIQNDDGTGSGTALYATFDRVPVADADVLVRYTYFGDANLDGKVDGADYARIDAGFLSGGSLTGWFNGDFNYDGKVDASDYTLIDDAFNTQAAPLTISAALGGPAVTAASTDEIAPVAGTSAVPEPATLGLVAVAAGGLLARRRRM